MDLEYGLRGSMPGDEISSRRSKDNAQQAAPHAVRVLHPENEFVLVQRHAPVFTVEAKKQHIKH